ncbi:MULTISPECIES: hydroxymethylbilane synthase [Lacrimispora]|uniref:hydroxymethylbilane synthase n=1 Tax=Lacrimispora TaxID=2719231 RepID=UPI000BE42FCB|nr:hydroxymethylbilane synthase [Lacrimispora amygdalina]MDK2968359.1 hydroxymethylbilane synthase [Lacrimispora sp.]
MNSDTIRIGTRKSALAVAQTQLVADALTRVFPGMTAQLVKKQTEGDRILNKPLLEFGGKGVFVTEFEDALLQGDIDLAVHSAKDLPMDLKEGLAIVAVPEREDPRDVLITLKGSDFTGKEEIVIGTSSLRRRIQIEEIGTSLWKGIPVRCENLRGNVQTRLKRLLEGDYDGIILAAAGLNRLGIQADPAFSYQYFDCETMIPAGGQGILAVEGRIGMETWPQIWAIENKQARLCLTLERRILKLLNAGCHEPVGVYSRIIREGQIEVFGIIRREDQIKRIHLQGKTEELDSLAELAAKGL